jgi:predicted RNA-binding Zn-ribbon protein involved in translation (DUF1610 family)
MVFAFLIFWAIGASLLLACCALIYTERLTVLRTVPMCARCGYDVSGLPRTFVCPECGARERTFSKGFERRQAESRATVSLWAIPTICGLMVTIPLALGSQIASPENVVGIAANTATFLVCGVMSRVMLGWITMAASRTILWCCMACLTAALVAVMLDALFAGNINAKPGEILVMGPLLIAPFAGYGVGLGILLHTQRQNRIVRASVARVSSSA